MMTRKFFGGVRGFAIAGNSMRTRIFLFLFFASTSGLWAQQARQVREVREERVGVVSDQGTSVINRRIRVGEKKDGDNLRGSITVNFVNVKDPNGKANSGNGTGGNGNQGGMETASEGGGPGGEIELHEEDIIRGGGPRLFVRGDVNGDSQISIADAMVIMAWISGPGLPHPGAATALPPVSIVPCLDAADADDDGWLSRFDALKIVRYVFLGFVPLPAPSASSLNYIVSDCGADLTGDDFGCLHQSLVCN